MITRLALFFCTSLVLSQSFTATARAALILTINATNPSAAKFTATAGLSAANSSGQGFSIVLLDFFPVVSTSNLADFFSGNLRPAESSASYTIGTAQNQTSIFRMSAGNLPHTFVLAQVALTGQSTFNFSSLPALRGGNFVGDIRIFNDNGSDTGVTIGQYNLVVSAVPEPSSYSLMVTAASAVILIRLKRRFAQPMSVRSS